MKVLEMNGKIFHPHEYKNEAELQKFVERNVRNIFGEDSVWFSGTRIGASKGSKGAKGIPDGFVFNLKRQSWTIVEVELARHSLHDHINPQVTRFAVAWKKNRKSLVDRLFKEMEASKEIYSQFKSNGIAANHYKFISDLVEDKPNLAIVIDAFNEELDELKDIVNFNIVWSIFRTYKSEDSANPSYIFDMDVLYSAGDTSKRKKLVKPLKPYPTRKLVFLGKAVPFRHSKEIPVIVADELIRIGKLTESMIPWGPGKRRYLVSAKPVHPKGNEFFQPVRLSNGWWVETHASEEHQISLSSRLIEHCGEGNEGIAIDPM